MMGAFKLVVFLGQYAMRTRAEDSHHHSQNPFPSIRLVHRYSRFLSEAEDWTNLSTPFVDQRTFEFDWANVPHVERREAFPTPSRAGLPW